MYTRHETGGLYTKSYRLYIKEDNKVISLWHDIDPFVTHNIIRVVNEIPRFTNGKFEMSKADKMNPIVQDQKNNLVRFVHNIYPFKGYPWNYGFVPMTWEDPNVPNADTKMLGDDDPLDVIEIGDRIKERGEIYEAKILGCIALIDDGECDWKVVVIDTKDPKADACKDINDVESLFPRLITETRKWFRFYKCADGKPENTFGLEGQFQGFEYAINIVKEAHESYLKLYKDNHGHSMVCSSRGDDGNDFVVEGEKKEDGIVPEIYDRYYYPPASQEDIRKIVK